MHLFPLRGSNLAIIPPTLRAQSWRSLLALAAILITLTAFTSRLHAQENAVLTGTVTDPSGAVIPNATVVLTDTATGQERQSISNAAGIYVFANLAHGTDNVTASAQGFQKYSKTGVVLNVAQTRQENVTMAVGSQAQTVTVEANSLQVQTETSEVSNLINGEEVAQLSYKRPEYHIPRGTWTRRLQQLASVRRSRRPHLIQRNRIQRNTPVAQYLPHRRRRAERSRLRRLLYESPFAGRLSRSCNMWDPMAGIRTTFAP